jgi:hypothetical protein
MATLLHLWQLFYIMSVGLVEYNLMIGSEDPSVLEAVSVSTVHLAETWRNFVQEFFACEECRRHLVKDYDGCGYEHGSSLSSHAHNYDQWIQMPTWWFEMHNAVNHRLVRERAAREQRTVSDEEVQQSQWPSQQVFPKCWSDRGGYDDEVVYKFLRTEYWYDSVCLPTCPLLVLVFALANVPPPAADGQQQSTTHCLMFHEKNLRGLRPGDRYSLKRKLCGRPTKLPPRNRLRKRQPTAKSRAWRALQRAHHGQKELFLFSLALVTAPFREAAQAFKPWALSRGGPQGSNDDEGYRVGRHHKWCSRTTNERSLRPKASRLTFQ